MKYTATSLIFAGFAALASAAENAFIIPTSGFAPVAGKTIDLNWEPTAGKTVTLVLRAGASSNLKEGSAIAEKIENTGSFTWSVDSDVVRGSDYTIEIINDDDPTQTNYFPYFVIDSTVTVAKTTSTYTYGAATTTPAATSVKAAAVTKSASASDSEDDEDKSTLTTSTRSGSASASASASASKSDAEASATSSATKSAVSKAASETSSETTSSTGTAPTSGASATRRVAGGLAVIVAAVVAFAL